MVSVIPTVAAHCDQWLDRFRRSLGCGVPPYLGKAVACCVGAGKSQAPREPHVRLTRVCAERLPTAGDAIPPIKVFGNRHRRLQRSK